MSFPPHIERVLSAYGIRADTKAALYELYLSLGAEVLEVFADVADGVTAATMLEPDDTLTIREQVVERYLTRNHPRWLEGLPTASLWHPREAEGRASGAAVPLGELPEVARRVVGDDQPFPDGILLLGRNAHSGGRAETISFDVIPRDLQDAIAVGKAEGRQHTIPGSVGATSGTFDSTHNTALIWEVQPNVYKPAGERNHEIAKVYRKHRNWHLITLACALDWLVSQGSAIYVLRGAALAVTHEANPDNPVSDTIAALHDRTVEQVVASLGATLEEPSDLEEMAVLDTCVLNHSLRKYVLQRGLAASILRLRYPAASSK
ncbi:MAG TPA: hypothetical protein VE010_06360 [Thermoanaerobaculia bacterium]|nr:hypothetical protein [Thermoanaerobaculia bacterium]